MVEGGREMVVELKECFKKGIFESLILADEASGGSLYGPGVSGEFLVTRFPNVPCRDPVHVPAVGQALLGYPLPH